MKKRSDNFDYYGVSQSVPTEVDNKMTSFAIVEIVVPLLINYM